MQSVLYVDSRARTGGTTDSSFSVDLRSSLHLTDHGMRVDNIHFVNSFLTTDRGHYVFYKNGTTIQHFSIAEQAYTGSQLAAALQSATGRTTTYNAERNDITQSLVAGQEWLSDAALRDYTTGFPAGATGTHPLSLNSILGEAVIGSDLVWKFVSMAPYTTVYLRSRTLTIHESHDPLGRHDVLCCIPLKSGIGSIETGKTPDGVYLKLTRDIVLRNVSFELTDYQGNIVNLRGRSLNFEICFD